MEEYHMMDLQPTCLLWKSSQIPNTWEIGYIMADVFPFIMKWENTNEPDSWEEFTQRIIKEKGNRYVIRYDCELESIDKELPPGIVSITDKKLDEILFGEHTIVLNEYPVKGKQRDGKDCSDQG
jgi:hypothetical protein